MNSRGFGWNYFAPVLFVALGCVIYLLCPTDGDFWWFDSSRHAMNGVFLRDLILEGGLRNPVDFARSYYERYPALTLGFYPPLLALSMAPWLMIFEPSHAVCQAVIVSYAAAGAFLVYLISLRFADTLSAVGCGVAYLFSPIIALWSSQVQPDIPAVSLVLASVYLWLKHRETHSVGFLMACGIFMGLAQSMRIQTVFAFPVFFGLLFLLRYEGRPAFNKRAISFLLACAAASPAWLGAIVFRDMHKALATSMPGRPSFWSVESFSWYLKSLPGDLDLPLFGFCVFGMCLLFLAIKDLRRNTAILVSLVFLGVSWFFFTAVSNKEPRFNIPSLPFLIMLATAGWYAWFPSIARFVIWAAAGSAIISTLLLTNVPYIGGFRNAAEKALELADRGSNILVSAQRDGSFIFNSRIHGQRKDYRILRADKVLINFWIVPHFGFKDSNLDHDAILKLLDDNQVSVVVSQSGYMSSSVTMERFERVLKNPEYFEPVARFDYVGNPSAQEHDLVVFKRRH